MILLSYAASASHEEQAFKRTWDSPHASHIVLVDPFNHATARNAGLAYAIERQPDWLIWMDADWTLVRADLAGDQIIHGQILHYPHARAPWKYGSVFAIPRALLGAVPKWDDVHFTNHWADVHWACVLCKRAGLKIRRSPGLRVDHEPHPIKPPGRDWLRAKKFYDQERLTV